ncbi:MAG: hypothetical protein KBC41_01725 [Candidatus Pacebacteria bacterium]|nr:hypothetical protein [Candidatus Paceibacterota bacterium]MBP9866777.1 hypothetical protein [Candidatus Paceibacterota bacterium]
MKTGKVGKRTRLILIEGDDVSSKEKQTKLLVNQLRKEKYTVANISFPYYIQTFTESFNGKPETRFSPFDYSEVYKDEAKTFCTSKGEDFASCLEALIKENDIVVFDRYIESNLLFYGSQILMDIDKINFAHYLFNAEYKISKMPKLSDVVYLSVPWSLMHKRFLLKNPHIDTSSEQVKNDIEAIKKQYESGNFYSKLLEWKMVSCVSDFRDLSEEEVHNHIMALLGFRCHI